MGLHLAGHGDHDETVATRLAMAATHGHHHDEGVTPHDHSALRSIVGSTPLLTPADTCAYPPLIPEVRPVLADLDRPPAPTGSPPLFYTHCALLL